MRPVTWLHVSDFHFRDHDSWSQNAVLSAMLAGIASRCASGLSVDFVLASGDLAFSGHNSQYDLVGTFFRDLASNLSLPTTRIFCVPGNHDVQRDRRTTCFAGAQVLLQSHNDVYAFLADTEERNTLLARQENFRRFQADFFAEQPRTPTADDLILQDHAAPIEAYVTSLAALCPTHAGLLEQLMTRNDAAASIAEPHDANPFHHTLTLLDEYLAAGDWDGLRELASRSCDLPDPAAAAVAKRMLALCLARSSARADRDAATDLYCHLADSAHARADDWAALAALLTDNGRHEEAKAAIRDGVRLFPHKIAGFIPIGMRIVEATGDLTFRDELRGQQREETLR